MKNWEIELKKKFFDNYYGVDDDKDTFSLTEYALSGIKQFIQNLLDEQRKEIRKKVERIKLDMDIVVCDCGEPYKGTDPSNLINELLKELNNQRRRLIMVRKTKKIRKVYSHHH